MGRSGMQTTRYIKHSRKFEICYRTSLVPHSLPSNENGTIRSERCTIRPRQRFGGRADVHVLCCKFKISFLFESYFFLKVNPKPEVQFSKKSRCGFNEDLFVITRFFGVGIPSGCSGNNNYKLGLTVDRRIFVAGFGLYGNINCKSLHRFIIL